MSLAILSDIHGNIEALRAVLADIDALEVSEVISLGDNVGYGPRPEEVVRLLRRRGIASVMGNHEAGLCSPSSLAWFNPVARTALDITRGLMSAESLAFAASLPDHLVREDMRFVHGAPPRAINSYLFEFEAKGLTQLFRGYPERICFAGHTHDLKLYSLCGERVEKRRLLLRDPMTLDRALRHIVNVGSVGQPRDGDSRAKYVIFNQEWQSVQVRRVTYDIETAAREIVERGLPECYARRLGKRG